MLAERSELMLEQQLERSSYFSYDIASTKLHDMRWLLVVSFRLPKKPRNHGDSLQTDGCP
jgi:hypothetical protein